MRRAAGRAGRKMWRLLAGTAAICTALIFPGTESRAGGYSYAVTFYPGNHGTFQGTGQVSVDNSASGSSYEISGDGSVVRVTGLSAGDIVSFDAAQEGAVELDEGSRYYVKGIRVSGRDNSTVDTSAFKVEGDRDYVVAYGIRGDLTSYVVHYRDTEGNTLAPSQNYYGNVGDKPMIAFRYIEGYQPQAYNLTKTLSQNTAENEFVFTYRRIPVPTGGGETGETGTDTETGTGGVGTGGNPAVTPDNRTEENQGPGGADEGQEGDAQGPGGADEGQGEDAQGPDNILDLDDENLPLAGPVENGGFPVWVSVCIAIVSAAAVGFALWFVIAGKKKQKGRE